VAGETDSTGAGVNFAQCFLESDNGLIQQQNEQIGPPDQGTYSLTGAISLPNGGTIILRCGTQTNTGVLPINFVDNSLTVIQVDAIN
jgi:hypothetical protein